LAGYGLEPGKQDRKLQLTEVEEGVKIDWVIELVGDDLPCQDAPLVLAALLKLLLCQPSISHNLEFEVKELLTMLHWPDEQDKRQQVEKAIISYVRLLYDKWVDARRSVITEGGCYHLLVGYFRETKLGTGGKRVRTHSVEFDTSFIAGLKRGRVYFAGIDFGALNQMGKKTAKSR